MATQTPATRALSAAKITYEVIEYDYVQGQDKIGLHAASAIGEDPQKVLKTLMVLVDDRPACVVIPSGNSLSMKKVASAFGGKSAQMMPPDKAERLTGFHTGGISPFGQKRACPTAMEQAAMHHDTVVINGGKRGMMVRLSPADAMRAAKAEAHPLCAE